MIMGSEILLKDSIESLFETDKKVDIVNLKELNQRTVPYRPRIFAEGLDSRGFDFYSELIGDRIYRLPRYFGEMSSRLGGYKGSMEDLLRTSVYTIKPLEEGVGGYSDPRTKETGLNAELAYNNRRTARYAITH